MDEGLSCICALVSRTQKAGGEGRKHAMMDVLWGRGAKVGRWSDP